MAVDTAGDVSAVKVSTEAAFWVDMAVMVDYMADTEDLVEDMEKDSVGCLEDTEDMVDMVDTEDMVDMEDMVDTEDMVYTEVDTVVCLEDTEKDTGQS